MQQQRVESEAATSTRFLTFLLGTEEFGVDILRVKEIIQYDTVSNVPNMPIYIRGVINLRGTIVPVLDLARRFALREQEITKKTCIIMVEAEVDGEPITVGFLTDSVCQVRAFRSSEIDEVPHIGTPIDTRYMQGMGKVDKRLVMLLDVDGVLRAGSLSPTFPPSSHLGVEAVLPQR